MKGELATSIVAELDREIEDTMGRIMSGDPKPGDYGRVSDLTARKVELTEPAAFARVRALLGIKKAAAA